MKLNSLHMRAGAIAGGVIVIGMFFLMGGSFGGEQIIQLDFSMYPELFEGCQVEIDGKVVGELASIGQASRSGFEVSKGRHTVRVIHPEMDCEPHEVTLEKSGAKARLLLDVQERYDRESRSSETVIYIDG